MNAPLRPGDWLRAAIAQSLQLPPEVLDPRLPLTRYGMDSLSAVEIAAAVAAAAGRELPASLLFDYPSIEALEAYLELPDAPAGPAHLLERMLEDALLPAEIQPAPHQAAWPERALLLTGATGFLGAHLAHALLRQRPARIVALARARSDEEALSRVRQALVRYGLWEAAFEGRLTAIACDLRESKLSSLQLEELQVDALYHCAAAVNWVLPYESLWEDNVLATRKLLTLACGNRSMPFHLVSSAAVCYAAAGPEAVFEDDDMIGHLAGLPLGYAQSKCVAEALVREAARRGLPASIYRPALIGGAEASGISNPDDLVSRLIRACVAMRCAPDLDWTLDLVPVDFAARAIARLSLERGAGLRVHHLANPSPRSWREAVLWMNLYGYPIRLVSFREWLERLEREADEIAHPLFPLVPFFRSRMPSGIAVPEFYEETRRSRLDCTATRVSLDAQGLMYPSLSSKLLERYFDDFVRRGLLPAVPRCGRAQPGGESPGDVSAADELLTPILRRYFDDPSLEVDEVARLAENSEHSIISELAGWKAGAVAGLARWHVKLRGRDATPRALDVVVKTKAKDEAVIEVGRAVAYLAGDRLGDAFLRHGHAAGFAASHLRELAIYAQQDPRFTRHAPRVFGTVHDDAHERWVLVMEHVACAAQQTAWTRAHVETAITGVAALHAMWWGRACELEAKPWIGTVMTAARMHSMTELWRAMADHAQRCFTAWAGNGIRGAQDRLIDGLSDWRSGLDGEPRTLIHNDFNPRNLALRRTSTGMVLCAYDWELATLGAPQHDVAELLCFVLDAGCERAEVLHYLEVHRTALERACGESLDPNAWQRGFRLSLADLIVNRLPMYAIVHAIRPQPFLPRVVRTWSRLHELFPV